jgi:hypothetical protein
MNIKQQGTEEFQAALKLLKKLGARIYGAELLDTPRLDSDNTNTDIVDFLTRSGRDFFSLGNDEGKILQMATDQIIKGIDNAMSKKGEVGQGRANSIMGGALKKALKAHVNKNVLKRIKTKKTAKGGTPDKLSDDYKKWRQSKFGIPQDKIGVATGQLLEALARGTIRLKSGK